MINVNNKIYERVSLISDYIIATGATIRETALKFNVSKSTVHKDIKERLLDIDLEKYKQIKKIMKKHIENRHINGGEATKKLFLRKKQLAL